MTHKFGDNVLDTADSKEISIISSSLTLTAKHLQYISHEDVVISASVPLSDR